MPTTEIERRGTVVEDFDPIVSGAINLIGNWIPIIGITSLAAIVRCHELVNDNLTDFECYPFVKNRRLGLEKSQNRGNGERPESCCVFHREGWRCFFEWLQDTADSEELDVPQR